MSGLVLNLKPNEKFIINGVVIQNGAKKSQIKIEDDEANVLRVSDAMHPKDVDTPVKRAYYIAQLLISCDLEEQQGREQLAEMLADLINVFRIGEPAERLAKAASALENRRYYSVLCQLKSILPAEEALLAYAKTREDEPEQKVAQVA